MNLTGTYIFKAPAVTVWHLLNDPDTIAACLPGCDGLEAIGDDRFKASLSVNVAAISGQYSGTVTILDKRPPHAYRLIVDGSGRAGFLKGQAEVTLADEGGTTTLRVTGDGQVGGLIARIGQRLLGSVSQMMMDRFFGCLQAKAESIAANT